MGKESKIEWTDGTWNPWRGCLHVSPGCFNCYMYDDQRRYGRDPAKVVRCSDDVFRRPLKWNSDPTSMSAADGWRGRRLIFTSSWTDFFIKEADPWRGEAWDIIRSCENLIFQVLTKRHGRIAKCLPDDWADGYDNVWLGVSGEDHDWAMRRVRAAAQVPAAVRYLSYEPALGPVDWDRLFDIEDPLTGGSAIDWVIIGGESGHNARTFNIAWARLAVEACQRRGVAAFVKQLGRRPVEVDVSVEQLVGGDGRVVVDVDAPVVPGRVVQLRDRKGGDWGEWPVDLRVRQWPGRAAA